MTFLETIFGFSICISSNKHLDKFDRFIKIEILTEKGIEMYKLLKEEKRND